MSPGGKCGPPARLLLTHGKEPTTKSSGLLKVINAGHGGRAPCASVPTCHSTEERRCRGEHSTAEYGRGRPRPWRHDVVVHAGADRPAGRRRRGYRRGRVRGAGGGGAPAGS